MGLVSRRGLRSVRYGLPAWLCLTGSPGFAGAEPVAADSTRVPGFYLARGAAALRAGRLLEAKDHLERARTAGGPEHPETERAAFLLAVTSLRLGEGERIPALADALDSRSSGRYAGWIRQYAWRVRTETVPESPAGAASTTPDGFEMRALLAARWLEQGGGDQALALLEGQPESGSTLGLYLRALALEALDRPAESLWRDLAGTKPRTPRDRMLVALATLRTAGTEGDDADPAAWIRAIPSEFPGAPRARLLAATRCLEAGRREEGVRMLESFLEDPLPIPERREAALRLAGLAMEEGRFAGAYGQYRAADTDWLTARETLEALADSTATVGIWEAWEASGFWPTSLPLVPSDPERETEALESALNLTRRGEAPGPGPMDGAFPRMLTLPARLVPPPAANALEPVRRAAREAALAEAVRSEAGYRLHLALTDLGRRDRYLTEGLAFTDSVRAETPPVAARLAALAAGLDSLQAEMERVKDAALDRFLRRTRSLAQAAAEQDLAARAMQRHHARGPRRTAEPDSLLTGEDALASGIETFARSWGEAAPGLLDASFEQGWSPGLAARVAELRAFANRVTTRGDSLATALLAVRADLEDDPALLALKDAFARESARADSLAARHRRLRDEAVDAALAAAWSRLEAEREPVVLGLGISAYELSLSPAAASGADSTGGASRYRAEALHRLGEFLTAYPESRNRADVRYRLADVMLTESRLRFEEAMAARLERGAAPAGSADLPVLDVAPALALYRSILAEDGAYAHRDAVLFNLGMALLEQGDHEGIVHLAELLRDHGDSPYIQEATLRLADSAFEDLDHATAIPLYERAAAGADPNLTAIALYRLGWSHFREDRFDASADAFRRLIDLYRAEGGASLKTDLADEAMEHFVQVLARGGGAALFSELFEAVGPRDYERKTLQGVAALYLEYSLYAEAIEADRLYLERYPQDPACLASARRLSACYEEANRPEEARAARLEAAERFLPGSPWGENAPDSLRREGETFARDAYMEAAFHHHRRGKNAKNLADWTRAGDLYATVLRHWPTDPEAGKVHLHAGEAASALDDFPKAREHFEQASVLLPASADTQITQADWELVALTDRWYRTTIPAGGGRDALGSDTLAALVRSKSAHFVERHPGDARGADALWRSGNLAFAHGWYDGAAGDFESLIDTYPRDIRVPEAAALRGDAWFRTEEYERARNAYESALDLARSARRDTLAARLDKVLPLAAHRHAESVAAADEARAAPLFAALASRWPRFEHADLAWYRAGLGYAKAGDHEAAIEAWTKLLDPPSKEFARDARLRISASYESRGLWVQAAESYLTLAETFPKHEDAPAAWLKSADLWDLAADSTRADAQRLAYIDRYPEDVAGGLAVLEGLAEREIRRAGDAPISTLTRKSTKPGPLARYLDMARTHPELASPALQARVQFLAGEEAMAAYRAIPLTLPLDRSIEAKKQGLDRVLEAYGAVAPYGVGEWARAATYRIGEALLAFGDALLASERPAGLAGEDLAAYDQVLQEQAWTFTDRGEGVWSGLLLETREVTEDTGGWIARTRSAVWPLLGQRFYAMPEVEHPLVAGTEPKPGESVAAAVKETPRPAESPEDDR